MTLASETLGQLVHAIRRVQRRLDAHPTHLREARELEVVAHALARELHRTAPDSYAIVSELSRGG